MTPRLYWQSYVDRFKGNRAVAEHLGIPYSTITSITNGHRGIGRELAGRMVAADPTLDASVLIWVRPIKPGADACGESGCSQRNKAA